MTEKEKIAHFDLVRLELQKADNMATEMHRTRLTSSGADALLRQTTLVHAAANKLVAAMSGIEPPKIG